MYQYAVELIKKGLAYVCQLSAEEMSANRGDVNTPAVSPYRDRPIEESLDLFERMRKGEFPDGAMTLRAKIDLASGNFNMRDPAIYRIKHMHHHRTGDQWCIYPMYDFAHPIARWNSSPTVPSTTGWWTTSPFPTTSPVRLSSPGWALTTRS